MCFTIPFFRDRPNSPNSDVVYSIVDGNRCPELSSTAVQSNPRDRKFSLEAGGQKAVVVLRKPLDLERGDVLFNMTLLARDRGVPPLSSTSSLVVGTANCSIAFSLEKEKWPQNCTAVRTPDTQFQY